MRVDQVQVINEFINSHIVRSDVFQTNYFQIQIIFTHDIGAPSILDTVSGLA